MNESLAELYIERDNRLHLNSSETIIKNLKKLNYYNIDIEMLKNKFISNFLINEVKANNYYLDDNNYYVISKSLNDILQSNEYKKYIENLNYNVERNNILSNYNNIADFYNNCTNDELLYLGY